MGQYHIAVNLHKREFIHPHRVGDGLKMLEQVGSRGGIVDAVALLLMASGKGGARGGGDANQEMIGRWAGDRVAWVGDYNQPGDIHGYENTNIYTETWASVANAEDLARDIAELEKEVNAPSIEGRDERLRRLNAMRSAQRLPWRDISSEVREMLGKVMGASFSGEGWIHRELDDRMAQ